MYKLTLKQYNKIHKDYRGTCNGKKEAFNGSIRSAADLKGWGELQGTTILTEGLHFEIVPECSHKNEGDEGDPENGPCVVCQDCGESFS